MDSFTVSLVSYLGVKLSLSDCWTKFYESFCEKNALGLAILFAFYSTLTAVLGIICWDDTYGLWSFILLACSLALAIIFSPLTRRFSIASPLFLP